MATSFTSEPTIISSTSQISYAVVWSGTPIGTLQVQASNDYSTNNDGSVRNTGTWNTLILSFAGATVTSIPITGTTGNGVIDLASTGLYAIRLSYTASAGTGTLTATINAKVA